MYSRCRLQWLIIEDDKKKKEFDAQNMNRALWKHRNLNEGNALGIMGYFTSPPLDNVDLPWPVGTWDYA